MKVLVINSGSSSLKYELFDTDGEVSLAKGIVEKIGEEGSRLRHQDGDEETTKDVQAKDHDEAFQVMIDALLGDGNGVLKDTKDIDAVGHRVVHGGEAFVESTLITEEVERTIEQYADLAPLHNPPNLRGIRAAKRFFPDVPHVAVFDTAFHQTMPEHAYLYALPFDLYERYGIRRYGFHGTSHRFVSRRAAEILGVPYSGFNCITAHLGNGCSLAAVKGGKSVDTSMGLTPLEGPMMGTRSGSIDPSILLFLQEHAGLSAEEIDSLLNKKSGLLGVSGVSNDMRDIHKAADTGNKRAQLALDMFAYQVRRYIGAYLAVLGRTDALVFTAGIGERDTKIRARICRGLENLGIVIDDKRNEEHAGKEGVISTDDSPTKILVVPTNEELMIARDTLEIARKMEARK